MTQEIKNTSADFEPVLWTVQDLMRNCHFSRSRAYDICADPKTPVVRIGGRVFILRKKFIEQLEQSARTRDRPAFDG